MHYNGQGDVKFVRVTNERFVIDMSWGIEHLKMNERSAKMRKNTSFRMIWVFGSQKLYLKINWKTALLYASFKYIWQLRIAAVVLLY